MKNLKIAGALALSAAGLAAYLAAPAKSDARASAPKTRASESSSSATSQSSPSGARTAPIPRARVAKGEQTAWSVLGSAVGELRRALSDPKRFPELMACGDARAPRCQAVFSEAMRKALVHPVRSQLIERLSNAAGDIDVQTLRDIANETLTSSDDATTRVPLLVMVDLAKTYLGDGDWTLDAAVYSRLGALTDLEQTLLLSEYAEAPPNERSVLSTVEALATDAGETTNVRHAAVRALAETGAASEVASALTALGRDGLLDDMKHTDLGRALSRCGTACAPSIRSLSRSPVSKERQAALIALTLGDQALRAELERDVLAALPRLAQQDFAERDQRRYLARRSHALAKSEAVPSRSPDR